VHDLWTTPLGGGEATLLRENAAMGTYAPDGSIVFLDHAMTLSSRRISIMDGDGSNARSLVKLPNDEDQVAWLQVSPDGTMVLGAAGDAVHLVDIVTGEELGEVAGFFVEEPTWYGNDSLIED